MEWRSSSSPNVERTFAKKLEIKSSKSITRDENDARSALAMHKKAMSSLIAEARNESLKWTTRLSPTTLPSPDESRGKDPPVSYSPSKRKRPQFRNPTLIPSLEPVPRVSPYKQRNARAANQSVTITIETKEDRSEASTITCSAPSISGNLRQVARTTALQCIEYATKRQTAASKALKSTVTISNSIKTLLQDSTLAVSLARKSRAEAERAAERAEGSAKKVREASDLADKDLQRAKLELAEAKAQAQEAKDFLRKVERMETSRLKREEKDTTGKVDLKKTSAVILDCSDDNESVCRTVDSLDKLQLDDKGGTPKSNYNEEKCYLTPQAQDSPCKMQLSDSDDTPKSDYNEEKCHIIPQVQHVLDIESRKLNHQVRKILDAPKPHYKKHKQESFPQMQQTMDAGNQALNNQTRQSLSKIGKDQAPIELLTKPIQRFKGHSSPITNIATIDSQRFLSCSWDKAIRLWDADTGSCLRVFRGHGDWIHAIAVLNHAYFLSGSDDRTIKLWSMNTGECIRTFYGHESFVKAISVMECKEHFISGSRDKTIKLFNIRTGECIKTCKGHSDTISTLVSLNLKRFASGSLDSTIKIWDVSSGKCVRTLAKHTGPVKDISVVTDSSRSTSHLLVSASEDKSMLLWNPDSGQCLHKFGLGCKNISVIAASFICFICDGFFLSCWGNKLQLWHIPTGKCVKMYETPTLSLAVARLDDGTFVTGSDKILYLWNLFLS